MLVKNFMLRQFDGGAVRDTANGKIEYIGFTDVLVEHSFGNYMLKHQTCSDGSLRQADNWKSGWDTKISLDSMVRHVMDLRALHEGLHVYKMRLGDEERTHYSRKPLKALKKDEIDIEETVNAIRFNCGSYLLEHLK